MHVIVIIHIIQVLRGHRRCDGNIGDFCDSSSFSEHPLFGTDSTALQIFLYYDDVEVCNPLGSRAKKHKLGMSIDKIIKCTNLLSSVFCIALFYYTLGNISPVYRSSLDSIQLVAVTKSTTLQTYGSDHLLQQIMDDVKTLETVG